MARAEIQDQDGVRTVVVRGGVTLGDADELYSLFGRALEQGAGTTLRIDTRELTFADLSFVQLLLALAREAASRSISLDMVSAAGDVLEEALRELGCTQFFRPSPGGGGGR